MPKWLPQFMIPLWLLLFVALLGVGKAFGVLVLAVIALIICAALVVGRLRYLKSHPPDPELVSKPFWKF